MKTAIFSIGVFLISLFLGSCQPSETSCSVVDTGKTLDYKIGDKLLFSYNYTTVYPAPGVDSVYKRSGFIHPLKTLGGEVMTNCSPADHYHHFGLWYAWTKTTFEGNEIDFWNLHKKQGTVRFRNFEHVSDNGFVATLDHVVYPDSPAEKVAMNERLKINIGLSLVGVIAGEFLVSKAGLGYLIVYGGQVFQLDLVMTGVLILALMAVGMYRCITLVEHRVLRSRRH